MNSAGLNFNMTVVASVLSALVVTVLTWLFGFWPVVWDATGAATKYIFFMLSFSIPVPLGALVVGALVLLLFLVRRATSRSSEPLGADIQYSSKAVPTGAWMQKLSAEPEVLSDKEITMLKVLATADGRAIALDELAHRSSMSNLAAEQTADHLLSRGYLKHNRDTLYGSLLRLSPAGRDFVLSAGYTRQ